MRRILIDNARRKNRIRHGKRLTRVDLEGVDLSVQIDDDLLLRVDEALGKPAEEDPVKAQLVKLRFVVGLSIPEACQALGISETTGTRYWVYARAWLYEELISVKLDSGTWTPSLTIDEHTPSVASLGPLASILFSCQVTSSRCRFVC